MKKFLSLLLAVAMLLGCVPAVAEETPEWKINKNTRLIKRDSSYEDAAHIVVPGELDGVPVYGLEYMCLSFCDGMTQLTLPDSIRYFDAGTISNHYELTEVDLPDDLLIVRDGSFYNMPVLESLVIPPSVSLIQGSFNSCPSLKSITFEGVCPVFVFEDYYGMFTELAEDCVIYVPDDQVDAFKAVFADREEVLTRIQPSGRNAVVIDWTAPESDFKFDASTGTITGYTGSASRLEIPASIGGVDVKHIGDKAFLQCYSLCYVVIPEGVETVGKQAFHGNTLMTYVSFPTTLHTIGDNAFGSNNLVSVRWSEGLESVGSKAFYNCDIDYAVLPASLRTIAASGFEQAGFVHLTFGPNVETVGEKGFAGRKLVEINYTGSEMPKFGAEAFKDNKKEATLTLADGASKELYDGFVSYMAEAFPTCVVNEPAAMEMPFPELDVMAGMPFFGEWHDVAGMNVMGEFTGEYPATKATLNPDGTGTVVAADDEIAFGWYVEEGYAFLAPVENGKPNGNNIFCFASIDENGRLVMDYGYAAAICEQEGKIYAAPAVPEIPLPEFDPDNAKYFIGKWEVTEYIVDGETLPADMIGPMTLVLNDDGTALLDEGEEETHELRWAAEYAVAYLGENMNDAAEITFDGTGNIFVKLDASVTALMAPKAEVKVIEGADELLGEWLDDIGNRLTLVNDGTMTYTYASDGWTYEEKWDVVDGAAMVTEGRWAGAAIYMRDGIVFIDNDEGVFQLFSADGDLSAYYGEEEALPEATPIGAEGEPYFGNWKGDMFGMEVTLTLNPDGTCVMEMMGEAEPGVWSVVDGKANVMDDEFYIDGDGNLVFEAMGTVFSKAGAEETAAGDDEMSEEEALLLLLTMLGEMTEEEAETETADPCIGVKYAMSGAVVQGIPLTAEQLGCAGDYVIFNADGSAKLVMGGIDVQTLGWTRRSVNVLGVDYEDGFSIDYYGTKYNFAVTETGLLMDYFGMLRTYEKVEGETTQAVAPAADPFVDKKFLCTGSIVQGMKLTAEQLGCAGDYVIFNADGSVELVMSGIPVQTLGWTRGTVNVLGTDYEGFSVDYYGIIYNFAISEEGGLLLDYFGMLRTYEAE